jgi:hypothetical protein
VGGLLPNPSGNYPHLFGPAPPPMLRLPQVIAGSKIVLKKL